MKSCRNEFHMHTRASHDSLMGRYALLAMCRFRHIDCVAITDHNEIKGAIKLKPWLEARGLSVIVGEEVFTSEGEIIGLWLTERIERGLTPEETVRRIKAQGGSVYVPHPYDEKRYRTVLKREALLRIAEDVDCIEVHNGRNVEVRYDHEQELAFKEASVVNPSIRRVIGCDAHCIFEVGRNIVITDGPVIRDNFPACLNGAVFEGKSCHPLAHCTTRVVRFFKLIAGGDLREISRILARKLSR